MASARTERDRIELLHGTLDLIALRALATKREAKSYAITTPGTCALGEQTERWRRVSGLVDARLLGES